MPILTFCFQMRSNDNPWNVRLANLASWDITRLVMLSSWSHYEGHFGQSMGGNLELITSVGIDHLGSILLPKHPSDLTGF
ncbi:hypothetical protein N7491_000421 [Penicillium cf. griseofulvum]|nr:hypothetical protein N7491_000421 [Penicillium cf. griseofulvum]